MSSAPMSSAPSGDGTDPALDERLSAHISAHTRAFEDAMRDDFNTPRAVAALFGLTTDVNAALGTGTLGRLTLERARDTYLTLGGGVLGLFAEGGHARTAERDDTGVVSTLMDLVLRARHHYRLNKQYAEADELRRTLAEVGVTVEDTKDGARWKR